MIPKGRALRVVGDVHGDARGFAAAVATDRFIIQLGDLTDGDGDSAEALRIALRLVQDGNGLFLMGNHDHKLARALAGRNVRVDEGLAQTLAELGADPALREEVAAAIPAAPFWLRDGTRFFVHGAFHPDMLTRDSPPFGTKIEGPVARALFGQTTGRMQPDGYPERVLEWVNRIPPGLTVYCGHDRRSTDGRPYIREGALGGRALFLDTGAGKGGHLSWIDLPA